mmetsp:Transcript_114066/g.362651  ORF Transcript_114066/g.362651 Transcript_114066/m.362651 type:complete len:182 (-) Transcript_114066:154-699(-)|eukprot:CAMPEP_0203848626 /NCGR_PEP_ID=MMETSP0359-20131031/5706_1 /ASSEMBLY_ACC=CAM_ASM_000338 /TAXON_ID=268821 /ORGANISM="Scrippsiella Hangoei, Strain SHTV-5" /LENGTH=181 /DNA_ID=CAMNT_0050764251 /DNA_START=26 /DNA_END=571 /DNA_ORIENTATION=-
MKDEANAVVAAIAAGAATVEVAVAAGAAPLASPACSPSASELSVRSALKLPLCSREHLRKLSVSFGNVEAPNLEQFPPARSPDGAQSVDSVAHSLASMMQLAVGSPAASPAALSTRSGASTPGARGDFWRCMAGVGGQDPSSPTLVAQRGPPSKAYCALLYRRAARPRWSASASSMPRCKV